MTKFHSNDYIDLIKSVTPENKHFFSDQLYRCLIFIKSLLFNFKIDNFGKDSPVIERLYEFCCTYTQASLLAAKMINENIYNTVINWSGGLHHAKQAEASGFCYINDVVLAILELLKNHQRVLYIGKFKIFILIIKQIIFIFKFNIIKIHFLY